jgi:hypothetical protein
LHVAVIGELPEVGRDMHPGILFPLLKNVTRPGALTVAVSVVAVLKLGVFDTLSEMVVLGVGAHSDPEISTI